MLRSLLCCCLLGLALGDHYGAQQPACEPLHETLTVTRTSVDASQQSVTQLDLQYEHQTVGVTNVLLVPSTVVITQTITFFPEAEVVTHTSLVTATDYLTTFVTQVATALATQTSHLVATAQEVQEQVITQTAVVDQSVTNTFTVTSQVTTYETFTVTDTFSTFVTVTGTDTFVVTETTFQTALEYVTDTVTSLTETTLDATVTVTEQEYITKCPDPKITYNH